jgi:hypothetical protein
MVRPAGWESSFFGPTAIQLEVLPSLGRVLPRDVAPPDVEWTLEPVIDATAGPLAYDSRWHLTMVPKDECDSTPEITRSVVEMLPVPPGAAIAYEPADEREVRLYEHPSQGVREVLLMGPDEDGLRADFAAARDAGGFRVRTRHTLRLLASDDFVDEWAPTAGGARLAQRFELDGTLATSATTSRPGGDVWIALTAEDAAGHRETTRISFLEERARAAAELCDLPELPDLGLLCDEER